jgi:hypothetical protein
MRHGCRLLFFAGIALLGGCASQRHATFMETRDAQYRDALTELLRTDKTALTADERQGVVVSAPETSSIRPTHRIVLGKLTGGLDRDGQPGDELLSVVVEPQDHFTKSIRTTGTLQILAMNASSETNEPIATWNISEEKLAPLWKQGLLNVGYHLELAWPTPPNCDHLRLIARLTAADGRTYEAVKDIRITLPPNARTNVTLSQPSPVVRVGHQAISIGQPTPLQPSGVPAAPIDAVPPPPLLP